MQLLRLTVDRKVLGTVLLPERIRFKDILDILKVAHPDANSWGVEHVEGGK